jgi:hypothetical protein
MGNLFGSTKTYQLEIEDKTSEKYTAQINPPGRNVSQEDLCRDIKYS